MKYSFTHLPPEWQACIRAFFVATEEHSGSINSRVLYESTLGRFLSDGRLPDTYSRTDILAFLNAKSTSRRNPGADVSPSTYCSRLQILNSFYKFASEYQIEGVAIIDHSPTFGLKYKKVPVHPRTLSMPDLEAVLDHLPGNTEEKRCRDRSLILAYWFTGKRRIELLRLTWGDLQRNVTIVDADGTRRVGVTFAYQPKGKSRETHYAEMPEPAYLSLINYLAVAGRLEHMQPHDPLWTSSRQFKGVSGLSKDYMNRVFKAGCEAAGLDASTLSLHVLRHSGALERYRSGQDLMSLKEWLGHSSLATSEIYLKTLQGTSDSFSLKLAEKYRFLSGVQ